MQHTGNLKPAFRLTEQSQFSNSLDGRHAHIGMKMYVCKTMFVAKGKNVNKIK